MTLAEKLILWAEKLRDVSALGLRFATNIYDREHFKAVQDIAMAMHALATDTPPVEMEPLRAPIFSRPMPFPVGDAAVIDDEGRILLIRRADNGLWAMPGGALEVGETPTDGVLREAFEASVAAPNDTYISERVAKDVRFHMTLAELSQDHTQLRTLGHLFDLLYLKYGGDVLFSQYMKPEDFAAHIASSISCHQQIFDAVVAKDLRAAKKALTHHIRIVKEAVLNGLDRMLEDKHASIF